MLSACGGDRSRAEPDRAADGASGAQPRAPGVSSALDADSAAPEFVLLPGGGDSTHVVVPVARANASAADSTPVDLLARSGHLGMQLVRVASPSEGVCRGFAHAGVAARDVWTIGISAGAARALPLDSLEGLSRADSLARSVAVTRLAVRVPADTVEVLSGLPYVVRGAWEFTVDGSVHWLVAIVSRTLELEADPRSEQLLLIGERSEGATAWRTVLGERRSGPESSVDTDDVLAAVELVRTGTPAVFVARRGAGGTSVIAYERSATGSWSPAWQRNPFNCNPS
jgi:hypothetical protein